MDRSSSGHYDMLSNRVASNRWRRSVSVAVALVAGLLLASRLACAAEAPPMGVPEPEPLPPRAEAAYQDLVEEVRHDVWLDEAVFTEIVPVTVPEVAIKLPPDQDH